MNEKSKMRRAKRQAQQEKQANTIIGWLIGVLVFLALVMLLFYMSM